MLILRTRFTLFKDDNNTEDVDALLNDADIDQETKIKLKESLEFMIDISLLETNLKTSFEKIDQYNIDLESLKKTLES